jgi:hypothetical protein
MVKANVIVCQAGFVYSYHDRILRRYDDQACLLQDRWR